MNFALAERAEQSARNVESMTNEMRSIAQSTKIETVSMRIITFVTLVYLPGTFVSVCQPSPEFEPCHPLTAVLQTLMSTPVVTFEPADFSNASRQINLAALSLFVEISVPLLLFTVAVWWVFKRRIDNKESFADCEAR